MECAVQHADGKNIVYIELISNAGFDLDNEWRKSIISLSDVLEDEIVEKIFLTYKRLSALEYRIKTTDRENEMQMIQLAVLIGQFFNENEEKVKEEYRKLLDILREKGKIKRNLYES